MEGNKKEGEEEKVKIYDKDMYISQEKLRTIVIVIVIFIIGFIAGYFSNRLMSFDVKEDSNVKADIKGIENGKIVSE